MDNQCERCHRHLLQLLVLEEEVRAEFACKESRAGVEGMAQGLLAGFVISGFAWDDRAFLGASVTAFVGLIYMFHKEFSKGETA